MSEQIGNALIFNAFYLAAGVGATGLTVTVDVYRNGTIIVTDDAVTEIGGGFYTYTLTSGNVTVEGKYLALFKTTDGTVSQQQIPAEESVGDGGIEFLDAPISGVADAVWDEDLSGHLTANTAGEAVRFTRSTVATNLNATVSSRATPAQAGAAVWDELTEDHVEAGSFGEYVSFLIPPIVAAGVWNADPLTFIPDSAGALLQNVPGDVWDELLSDHLISESAGEKLSLLANLDSVALGPILTTGGAMTLVRGDDYLAEDGRALSFTSSDWPDLTGADIQMTMRRRREAFGSGSDPVLFNVADTVSLRVAGNGSQTVVFELTHANTASLIPGDSTGKWDVQAILAEASPSASPSPSPSVGPNEGNVVTLVVGVATIVEDQTRA